MDPMVPQFLSGTTPWDDPSAYIKLSAVFRLDKVTTPILMADGYDVGDLLLDSIEMYNGLRWFGRDVTLLRYPGQGHVFTGSGIKDFSKRESEFFDKYLKPGVPEAVQCGKPQKPMIARVWHGVAAASRTGEHLKYIQEELLRAYRGAANCFTTGQAVDFGFDTSRWMYKK